MSQPKTEAPILEHLEELRVRIFWILGFWLAGSIVGWNYRTQILDFLQAPLSTVKTQVNLTVYQLTDQLFMSMSVALWSGLVVALPFIIHQVWLFIAPGLYSHERKWAFPFILGIGLSFGLGGLFCYKIILPAALPFLLDFFGGNLQVNLDTAKYIGQILMYLVVFGIIFELPIVAFILTKMGVVNADMLSGVRRYAIVVILILAAIITPTPDPMNMMLMAVPLYVLYELGIVVSRFATPRERSEDLGINKS